MSFCPRNSTKKHGKRCWLTRLSISEFRWFFDRKTDTNSSQYSDSIAVEDDRPLGALINSMCKAGQAQRLFSLPISGMEGYIEDELDLRARTADPLAVPFYHKVLYSWLIMRQDFRKGESTPRSPSYCDLY